MFDTNETLYKLEARDIEVRRMRLKKEDQRCVAKNNLDYQSRPKIERPTKIVGCWGATMKKFR